MKRFVLILLLVLISTFAYSSAKWDFEELVEEKTEDMLYHDFLKTEIPDKFIEPFYEMTKENKNIGLELAGIAYLESGWKVFLGSPNQNGSIDIGPMMLNSYNISNERFMNQFGRKSSNYTYDLDVYYMTICITYYSDIRAEYGPYNALQVYNGGPRTMRSDCSQSLKKTVRTYANSVYKHINRYTEQYNEFVDEHKDDYSKIVRYIVQQEQLEYFTSNISELTRSIRHYDDRNEFHEDMSKVFIPNYSKNINSSELSTLPYSFTKMECLIAQNVTFKKRRIVYIRIKQNDYEELLEIAA